MEEHEDHGNTLAAWVAVGILLLGSAIMSWAVVVLSPPIFIGGIVVCIVGLIAGRVLVGMGYGKDGAKTEARAGAH